MDSYEGEQDDPLSLHKYTFTSNNPENKIDPSGNDDVEDIASDEPLVLWPASQNSGTIYVNADTAFTRFPYKHTYVKLVPGNLTLLNKEFPGVFVNYDPTLKKYYATIGAGPDFGGVLTDEAILLVSGVNRSTDISKPIQINEKLPVVNGDVAIESLLTLNSGYRNNLDYLLFPDNKNGGYNSNSYTSGILAADGLPEPPIIESIADDVPGFKKPVPPQDF